MMELDRRQQQACNELVNSGAIKVITERMAVRIMTESLDNASMRDDRHTRAQLDNVKEFDRALQAIINQSVDMR